MIEDDLWAIVLADGTPLRRPGHTYGHSAPKTHLFATQAAAGRELERLQRSTAKAQSRTTAALYAGGRVVAVAITTATN